MTETTTPAGDAHAGDTDNTTNADHDGHDRHTTNAHDAGHDGDTTNAHDAADDGGHAGDDGGRDGRAPRPVEVPAVVNADQHAAWNGDSGHRWTTGADRRDRVLAPIADVLLAAADLARGEHVLDVGCGCGATTLAAATAVAPGGEVVGLDLSAPMLGLARQRATDRGATNVELVLGDAQVHPLPAGRFAVAISRFGTMFFADPVAAFANVAGALAPAGRLCVATWQPLAANDWLTIPGAVLFRYGRLPEAGPGAPGPFAQSDPDTVTATLREAGYADIDLDPVAVRLTLGRDPADATDYLSGTGLGRAALATIPEDQRPGALDAVQATLADHADAAGVHLGAAIWIVTATRKTRPRPPACSA